MKSFSFIKPIFVKPVFDKPVGSFGTTDPSSTSSNVVLPGMYVGKPGNITTGNTSDNISVSGEGSSTIKSGGGNDNISVSGGNNTVYAGTGNDNISTGSGNDTIYGEDGNDNVSSGAGDDIVFGGKGNDNISGGAGADQLHGGEGDDSLAGGSGKDTLTGGAGADKFVFSSLSAADADSITDFVVADDKIQFSKSTFTALEEIDSTSHTLVGSQFTIGTEATSADHHVIYDAQTGNFFYDADGNGSEQAILIGTMDKGLALTNANFVLQ